MNETVLMLSCKEFVIDEVGQKLSAPDVRSLGGTSLEDFRDAPDQGAVERVIMGPGIALDAWLGIVQHVLIASRSTTMHMKEFDSGRKVRLPFVVGVLKRLMA